MQIKTFDYTKNTGEVSMRDTLVLQEPSNMMLAIDISELDQMEQGAYATEMSKLYDEYMSKVHQLNVDYDVLNRIRKFDPLKMTNVTSEHVG